MSSIAYEDLLRRDGRVITHVVGWSMMPLLRNRESIVIVEAPDRVKPKKRDVVLYKTGNRYILHRILKIRQEEYVIRGDNTWVLEYVPKENVLATMTGFYRDSEGRYVAKDDILYQTYCRMLPCIRLIRFLKIRAKRYLKKNL